MGRRSSNRGEANPRENVESFAEDAQSRICNAHAKSIGNRSMIELGIGLRIELLLRLIQIGTTPKSKAANPDGIADTPSRVGRFNEGHSP